MRNKKSAEPTGAFSLSDEDMERMDRTLQALMKNGLHWDLEFKMHRTNTLTFNGGFIHTGHGNTWAVGLNSDLDPRLAFTLGQNLRELNFEELELRLLKQSSAKKTKREK